jgi:ABC-type uncharacterized transport system auxiliary subunit
MNREREGDGMKHFGIVFLLIGLAGCIGGTRPAPLVRQYVLEYPPPRVENLPATDAILMVARFSVDRFYAGPEMVFSQGPFQRGVYPERRWRVSPGDMVTDFLRRDLRAAGLFRAFLVPRDFETPQFILEGGLEEFLEAEEGTAGRKAVLVATLTLLDLSRREGPSRVVFQKTYRAEAAFVQDGAPGLAEAMSRAMSRFSKEVITDIARILKSPGR